jgi:nucleoside-triphosphatase THEP1
MSAHQLEVTVRGGQGSGKSTLIRAIIDAAHSVGFAVDLKQEGYFVGGTWRQSGDKRKRILVEEVQTDPVRQLRRRYQQESEPHRRWREHSMGRHVAILALVTLAIMAGVMSLLGAS